MLKRNFAKNSAINFDFFLTYFICNDLLLYLAIDFVKFQDYKNSFSYLTMNERKIRVLVAKPGLDGHDRGAKIIARALRDAGMEVIYTGLRQTPEMIAAAALQEDVDAVGISILSGAHNTLCPRIVNLLRENGMDDTLVLVGGIVPQEDILTLKEQGVSEIFLPGTSTEDIVKFINENVRSDN